MSHDTSTGPRLLGPVEVRSLAASLGLRPSKSRGQNFVIDPNTVRRIVRTSGVGPDDVVLEVGPGLGSLTLALLGEVAAVVAVEVDPVLAGALPGTVAAHAPQHADRFTLVPGDALQVRADHLVPAAPPALAGVAGPTAPTALVANLPYNVSVPVLLHLLAELPTVRTVLVMVQAEVADRLAAAPGSRTYGVPSVKAAWYAEVRRAGSVSRSVFWPAPNVDSGLVALQRREPPATGATREQVFRVVDAAFAQRRKTLRAALRSVAAPERVDSALAVTGVPPTARGEQLDVAAFARIAEALSEEGTR